MEFIKKNWQMIAIVVLAVIVIYQNFVTTKPAVVVNTGS